MLGFAQYMPQERKLLSQEAVCVALSVIFLGFIIDNITLIIIIITIVICCTIA